MHVVDIWTVKSALRKAASIHERSLVVGYGRPLLRVFPQVRGFGYGLTVTTTSGRVLLEVDLTGPVDTGDLNVLTVAKRAKYRVFAKPQRRTRSR
jgi:hypothetical protein